MARPLSARKGDYRRDAMHLRRIQLAVLKDEAIEADWRNRVYRLLSMLIEALETGGINGQVSKAWQTEGSKEEKPD